MVTNIFWLVVEPYPSEKSEKWWSEFVSWDDYSIPNWMESHKIPWFQSTTNQITMDIAMNNLEGQLHPQGPK